MANPGVTKTMWFRMLIVMVCLCVGFFGISGVRLAIIMLADSEFYQTKAAEQQLYDTVLSPARGNIYDTNMNLLATSATVWTVYITPNGFKNIKDEAKKAAVKEDIAQNLSTILELEYETVLEQTNKASSYVMVKRKVEKPQADKVREYISNSEYEVGQYIGLDESTKRYYTNDNLASVVLGFVGDDNQGLSGLELKYDSELEGIPGRVVAAKNAQGADMPFSYEKIIEAQAGNSLVLTIDTYMQYVCEKYLEQAVIDNKVSDRGVCIIMNVNTGAILSMAVKGDFNPNDPFTLSAADSALLEGLEGEERTAKLLELRNAQWRNKAISDPYEPGSVFKLITAAAALEESVTNHSHSYYCPGYIVVSGQRYNCHKRSGHGSVSLTQAMQNSCNPAFITMGQTMGTNTFYKYFDAFGLTQKTGIDLPGESGSIYHSEANMGPTELASTSFGQTFKITPIQLITAISATINGGYLVQPHVVEKIVDANENIINSTSSTVKRQVISKQTSITMREMMESVVADGGGKNAYVKGYRTGGKTGTSQKVAEMLESGESGLYVASYCGIAPADDPEIAILVLLDEPHGDAYYGGTISAPVAGQILSEILPYMGYEPQYSDEELQTMTVKVPNVTGKALTEAKAAIAAQGLKIKVVGNGSTVERQLPDAAQSVYKDGVVVVYTEPTTDFKMTTVPNFYGLTVSGANKAAADAGLNIEFYGTALSSSGITAYKQSIAAGTSVESGTIIQVYFRTEETADL